MYRDFFDEFLESDDTLRIYQGKQLIFSSIKDQLLPLLEYIERFPHQPPVVIFDKVMGNGAALLAVKANCREVYSPLGSKLATETLERYGIKYHLSQIVPYIQRADGRGMCPMEKLSQGKTPTNFYQLLQNSTKG